LQCRKDGIALITRIILTEVTLRWGENKRRAGINGDTINKGRINTFRI